MPPGSASGTACEGRQYSLPGCDIAPTLVVALTGFGARSISAIPDKSPSGASKVVRAAQSFLATLSEQQRAKVLYKFDDNAQLHNWSNCPTGVVQRGGLRFIRYTKHHFSSGSTSSSGGSGSGILIAAQRA